MASHEDSEKSPFYKKWWFWVIIVIIIVAIVGGSQTGSTNTSTQPENEQTEQVTEENATENIETNENVRVTLEQYDQIEEGMSYDEVVSIFGGKETSSSESEVAGTKSEIMTWNGNGTFSAVTIGFINGEVSSKSQTGLE